MSQLETENGLVYKEPTEEDITTALTALNTADNTFALLERNDGSLIQVANNGKKGFYVEIQDIKSKVKQSKMLSDVEAVINMFVGFKTDEKFKIPAGWRKQNIRKTYRSKFFNILSYIGLALLLVSLCLFLARKELMINPGKYVLLVGLWLMFPARFYDTLNFINDLRVGSFDPYGIKAIAIAVFTILFTAFIILKYI
jgi:hypothetical protein